MKTRCRSYPFDSKEKSRNTHKSKVQSLSEWERRDPVARGPGTLSRGSERRTVAFLGFVVAPDSRSLCLAQTVHIMDGSKRGPDLDKEYSRSSEKPMRRCVEEVSKRKKVNVKDESYHDGLNNSYYKYSFPKAKYGVIN
ncbi:hypothetical protein STEG23_038193, partial [Scotinomys teguina]